MYERKVFDRFFTEREEKALLKAARRVDCPLARRDAGWMLLARQTGLRVGALVGLTVGDARDGVRTGRLLLRAEIQKGSRSHQVFLTKAAKAALGRLLKVRRELRASDDLDAALLVNRYGRGMSARAVELRQKHWCAVAGTRPGSPHWWRHTCARRLMERSEAQDPRGIVQRVLGHVSLTTTEVYTWPTHEQVEAAMELAA